MSDLEQPKEKGVSRRTVTRAMAWSVPAIAVASTVPSVAASEPPGTLTFVGDNCKLPGNSSVYSNGGVYFLTVSNTTATDVTVNILSVARSGQSQPSTDVSVVLLSYTGTPPGNACELLGSSFTVHAGSQYTMALVTREWTNSASGNLTVTYTVDSNPQPPAPADSTSLNPITTNANCNNIGGSCGATDPQLYCILGAIGQPNCN